MASVRKRKWSYQGEERTSWVVEYTDASGKRRMKTHDSKKSADAGRLRIERELQDDVHTPEKASATVLQICDEYIKHSELRVKDGRIGRSSMRSLLSAVNFSITPILGAKLFAKLEHLDVERFYNEMVRGGLTPRTAKDRVRMLGRIQEFAKTRGYTKRDVITAVKKELRGTKEPKIRTFKPEEVLSLLKVAGGPKARHNGKMERPHVMTNVFVNVAAFCGLRYGEIAGLRIEDLDFHRRTIRIRQAVTGYGEIKSPKTAAGVRDVPMPSHVAELLQEWLARWAVPNDFALVFSTALKGRATGQAFSQGNFWSKCWRPLLIRAGLGEGEGLHFHALRHFAASWMIQNHLPVTEVARLLGHAKFDMTLQTYAHPVMDRAHQQEAMDRMASSLLDTRALPAISLDTTRIRHDEITI